MSSNSRPTLPARVVRWVLVLGLLAGAAFGVRRAIGGAAVDCVHARRGLLSQRLVLTGRVITPGTARLGVVTLGTVNTVHVDAGSHVAAGQPLLELNDTEQRAAVAQARAGVLLSAAQMGQVKRITNQIASASVDEARVGVEQARREFQRAEQLARSGSVSTQAVDTARDAVTAAESRLAAAEAREAGAKGPDSQVAGAKIAESRAALELAEARLAQTKVLAPADGTILERDVEPGDIVQPGKVLLVLARDGAIRRPRPTKRTSPGYGQG